MFGIKNIYFDFDKSNIRVEALDFIRRHESISKMKLDIRSHTDSRGSLKYNDSVSEEEHRQHGEKRSTRTDSLLKDRNPNL
jgi:hypothetical protein